MARCIFGANKTKIINKREILLYFETKKIEIEFFLFWLYTRLNA